MGLQLNVFGDRYDDGEPCFLTIESGEMVYNRVTRDWVTWASLDALATAESHTWQPREVGIPSIIWQLGNSFFSGQHWAPGLDDTSGLASEVVVNGDAFTGADTGSPGATPPTSWAGSGGATFQLFGDVINVYPDPVTGGSMDQTLTVTPGEVYVVELLVMVDHTPGVRLSLDGVSIPTGECPPGKSSSVKTVSFTAPASGSVDLSIVVAPGELASIDHIRCFLESELTGAG